MKLDSAKSFSILIYNAKFCMDVSELFYFGNQVRKHVLAFVVCRNAGPSSKQYSSESNALNALDGTVLIPLYNLKFLRLFFYSHLSCSC